MVCICMYITEDFLGPASLKGNQPWIFIGRTVTEAEPQYSGHLMRRADPDAGKDWRQAMKGVAEDELVR